MDISKFNEKLNRVDGNIYTIEEVVTPVGGVYEAELIHDNVELKTINVYTGPKLTGNKINTISFSTPSLTPWKTVIKIFSTEPKLYITYETTGDTVEAEDINNLQDAINLTQEELNKETNRATSRENNIEKNLNSEITRAKNAESTENTRATNRENLIENNLTAEIKRATDSENNITNNLEAECNRAKKKEEELNSNINTTTNNLANEINRSAQADKVLTDNLAKEIDRAKVKENTIESNLNNYKTSNDSEIQGLKAKDIDLDNKKANLDYVNLELNKRYTKDQTFTREEVLKKIQDLIGTAPDTLDTFKEIADALGNDPNFATTIMNELSSKVDKVTGKSLSTNDYDNTEKSKLSDVNAKKHEHSNKSIIDKITQGLLDAWNSAYNHIGDTIKHITSDERTLWNTVSNKTDKGHAHDDRYYTESEIETKMNSKANSSHTHSKTNITDMPTKLSQFVNDNGFITQSDIDTSQNHIHNNKSVLDKISQKTLDDINLSVDKVLKNKLTPIETDSTLTKLDNCIGEYVHNMHIRGRTLQNISIENNFTVEVPKTDFALVAKKLAFSLSPNKTYTISFDAENTGQKNAFSSIVLGKGDSDSWSFRLSNSEGFKNGKWVKTFTVPSNFQDTLNSKINFIFESKDCEGKIIIKNIMLLEGEPKEIPPFFEGIKSTGELEGNKISILTCGKNLFPHQNYQRVQPTKDKLYSSAYFSANNLKQNTQYNFSCKVNKIAGILNGQVDLYIDGKYKLGAGHGGDIINIKFTTPPFFEHITINLYGSYEAINNDGDIVYYDIQIEEGSIATDAEGYRSDKTEILITEPLRGLPNGVSDIVDFDKNERIKNVQKAIFNGSQGNWSIINSTKSNTILFRISVPDLFIIANNYTLLNCICNKFALMTATDGWLSDTKEGICQDPSDRTLRFNVLKSRLETPDVAGFKKLLKTWADAGTPLEVYYQLAEHKIEKLNIKDELQTFENGYIQLDNAITPSTQLEYSTNLPSALSGVVEIQDKILDRVNILEKKKSITWDELEGV